jgi:hypothetical protein
MPLNVCLMPFLSYESPVSDKPSKKIRSVPFQKRHRIPTRPTFPSIPVATKSVGQLSRLAQHFRGKKEAINPPSCEVDGINVGQRLSEPIQVERSLGIGTKFGGVENALSASLQNLVAVPGEVPGTHRP